MAEITTKKVENLGETTEPLDTDVFCTDPEAGTSLKRKSGQISSKAEDPAVCQ